MAPDRHAAVYVMSVAADLAGLHPQTLRLYERKGLLEPARTDGGNRRYSDADLDQLRRIVELTGEGVNIEGVRRIIQLETELDELRRLLDRARRLRRGVAPG
jgi:MerR family transcriptional regulator/heat shock protein HspR